MALTKTTTDPIATGINDDSADTQEYNDKWYLHREQGSTEWTPTGVIGRDVQKETGRAVDRLLRKLSPDGSTAYRVKTMVFPDHGTTNTYSYVTSNAAAAGAANTVPVTYYPTHVYLSTTETSGGLVQLSTTAGATSAVALNAGTADSGVSVVMKWGTTAAGSATSIAAGASALAVAGLCNNTATALYGIGVDGATNTGMFCVVTDSTTGGKVATTQALDQNWHEFELIRKSGTLTVYCDGTSVGTYGAGGAYLSTASAPIGALVSTAGSFNANVSVAQITIAQASKVGQ